MHQKNVRVLYKTILRLHRGLPKEIQELGDQYVKDEFKRHKNVSKEHVAPFMMEWANYCGILAKQIGLRGPKTSTEKIGISLEESQLDSFDDQQIYQLYELRQSIDPVKEIVKDSTIKNVRETSNLISSNSEISSKNKSNKLTKS